jgi:hypothetical protein
MAEGSHLDRFFGLFRGNRDFYALHYAPFHEENGKTAPKSIGYAKDKESGDFLPVTKSLFGEHLNGGNGLALAPLQHVDGKTNVCFYAVIDIDVYDRNFTWLVKRMYDNGLKFAAFLSKSGGLHLYFFFKEPEPGAEAVGVMKKVVDAFGLKKLFPSGKVEIFPKQTVYATGGGVGNCLLLPYYNAVNGSKQTMLTAEGKRLPLSKALPIMESMVASAKEIEDTVDSLPYSDAPICVQSILLSGALGENSGRNEFLFTAALYFKLKSPDSVGEELLLANDRLEAPLEEKDVNSIAASALQKDYQLPGRCDKSPCSEYCDKSACRLREYGVGRKRNNMASNVEFGKLKRVLAGEPYYLWEARLAGTEEYVLVRIDGEADLMNQKVVQKACIRYLNQIPTTVNQRAWEKTLNGCLANIEEEEVAEGTDTTEATALRGCFVRFLTHKRAQEGKPYMIHTGLSYYEDGVYYFTSEGIKRYLDVEKFNLRGYNLRERLISYGCSEGELAYFSRGRRRSIRCWKKPEDDELAGMDDFYEDIFDGDAETLRELSTGGEYEEEDIAF